MYNSTEVKYNQEPHQDIIKRVVRYSMIARRDGILALERECYEEEKKNAYFASLLSMTVDGHEPKTVERVGATEAEATKRYFRKNPVQLMNRNNFSEDELEENLEFMELSMKIIMDGVLLIQGGENPRTVEQCLLRNIIGEKYVSEFE